MASCKTDNCGCSSAALAAPAGIRVARYRIENMDCPTEERLIRSRLEGFPGIATLDFDLLGRTVCQPRGHTGCQR